MKILVILPRFPYPLEKGDKLRAYHQIRTLSKNNEVYLFALSHHSVDESSIVELRKYCKDICLVPISRLVGFWRVLRNLFSVRSLQIGYWDSRKAMRRCREFEAKVKPDVVYAQMIRTLKYAAHSPYPKVLDFQDALSLNQERRMTGSRGLRYFILHYEFKMLRSAEFNACDLFNGLTIISEKDAEAVPQHAHTKIDIVRNGVDFNFFVPQKVEKEYEVVFCGNMQYRPNIDACKYLVGEVMPIAWRTHPNARVVLAGATPTAAVRQLACDKVKVTGWVDDIRPYYAKSKLFVAPMRIGSGLQNKLLEAMSMGIPCVTTPLANDALGARNNSEVLLGNNAGQLAAAIVRLLDDEALRNAMAENAGRFVREHFSWEACGEQLEAVLRRATHTVIDADEAIVEE